MKDTYEELARAADAGDSDTIRALLQTQNDAPDAAVRLLHVSVMVGDTTSVASLLNAGVDPRSERNGKIPLEVAIRTKNEAMVTLLTMNAQQEIGIMVLRSPLAIDITDIQKHYTERGFAVVQEDNSLTISSHHLRDRMGSVAFKFYDYNNVFPNDPGLQELVWRFDLNPERNVTVISTSLTCPQAAKEIHMLPDSVTKENMLHFLEHANEYVSTVQQQSTMLTNLNGERAQRKIDMRRYGESLAQKGQCTIRLEIPEDNQVANAVSIPENGYGNFSIPPGESLSIGSANILTCICAVVTGKTAEGGMETGFTHLNCRSIEEYTEGFERMYQTVRQKAEGPLMMYLVGGDADNKSSKTNALSLEEFVNSHPDIQWGGTVLFDAFHDHCESKGLVVEISTTSQHPTFYAVTEEQENILTEKEDTFIESHILYEIAGKRGLQTNGLLCATDPSLLRQNRGIEEPFTANAISSTSSVDEETDRDAPTERVTRQQFLDDILREVPRTQGNKSPSAYRG